MDSRSQLGKETRAETEGRFLDGTRLQERVASSVRHPAANDWLSPTRVVRHSGEEPEVSSIAFDAAANVQEAQRDGSEADSPATIRKSFEANELIGQATAQVLRG